jgi:hypothetical protein
MTHTDRPFPGDTEIGEFLAARRKFIIGLLSLAGVLASGQLDAGLVVQSIIAFLGAYGIHEVAND